MSTWKNYEKEVHDWFSVKYPEHEILYDQRIPGRYSRVSRQVDILVRFHAPETPMIGVFDCKFFSKNVDVKTIDSLVGFIDDTGADYGGVITQKGFSTAAINRAEACRPKILTSVFQSPESLVDVFIPSFDFSDPRNLMYIALF